MNVQYSGGSRSFAKETRTLKMRSSGWPLEVDNNQLRGSSKLILLQIHEKLPKNSTLTVLRLFRIWTYWKDASRTDHKLKESSFCSVVFSYSTQQQQTISQLDCDVWQKVNFIPQLAMTSSVVRLQRSSKTLTKAKLTPKKRVLVTVRWSAARLIHYSFLNPRETITSEKYAQQINEMHQKLQRLQLALVDRKGPILFHDNTHHVFHNQCFKS